MSASYSQQPMPPGWYPTPAHGMQWWDGMQWTTGPVQGARRRRASPPTGWILAVLGALLVVGALLPWATALGGAISKAGTDGGSDGVITLFLGLLIAGLGVTIGLRQGHISVPIIAAVLAVLAALTAFADVNDVSSHAALSVGSGLWLTAAVSLAAIVVSVIACFVKIEA